MKAVRAGARAGWPGKPDRPAALDGVQPDTARVDPAMGESGEVLNGQVTLDRIADPELPDGCLVAQSTMAAPALSPSAAACPQEAVGLQCARLHSVLTAAAMPDPVAGASSP